MDTIDDGMPAAAATQIAPNLFMGGTEDHDVIQVAKTGRGFGGIRQFDAVVTLYAWAQPVGWEVEEMRYGFADGPVVGVDFERVIAAARWAHRRWARGDRVLVRCQAGLNRSGLVTALVLMLSGTTAKDAIQLIRSRRSSYALCNAAFEDWLLGEAGVALAELSSSAA